MKRRKSPLLLTVAIAVGAVMGSIIAEMARGSEYFNWLALGRQFGISVLEPFFVDLGIISLKLGLMFNVTVASVICIAVAVIIYRRV